MKKKLGGDWWGAASPTTNLPAAEHSLLSVSDQALLAEQVAVGALRHLLEGKLAVAAAALDQLTVLEKQTTQTRQEEFRF